MKLYDTMTRSVKEIPDDNPITIYTCGPTVYSDPHIGNWRAFIFYDTLVRALLVNGYEVDRTMNLTDVGHLVGDGDEGEDKLQKAANSRRKTAWDIAEEHIAAFNQGLSDLNMIQPQHIVRATDMIDEQIAMVKTLEKKGYAYTIDDGVYFDTSKLDDYGKLARLNVENQEEGARVEANKQKKNASDFALWKLSPTDQQRDMEWDSPWGTGFPGWHLECSVIAEQTLGKTLTIHTGGIDHIPVHHTNEIAQSEAANNQEFSKLWVHNEHILIEGKKMSKSLQNDYKLADVIDKGYSALEFRLVCLMAKYRTQQNFTWQSLQDAQQLLKSMRALSARRFQAGSGEDSQELLDEINTAKQVIIDAVANDLNTPEVLSEMNALTDNLEQHQLGEKATDHLVELLDVFDEITGLNVSAINDLKPEQYDLLFQRETLRAAKQYGEADQIRSKLEQQGIEINDTPWGSTWHYS